MPWSNANHRVTTDASDDAGPPSSVSTRTHARSTNRAGALAHDDGRQSIILSAICFGLTLATITAGTVTCILGSVENTVLLATDRLAMTDDDLDDGRTAPEIVGFNATQADLVLAAGQIAAALITFGPTTSPRRRRRAPVTSIVL